MLHHSFERTRSHFSFLDMTQNNRTHFALTAESCGLRSPGESPNFAFEHQCALVSSTLYFKFNSIIDKNHAGALIGKDAKSSTETAVSTNSLQYQSYTCRTVETQWIDSGTYCTCWQGVKRKRG